MSHSLLHCHKGVVACNLWGKRPMEEEKKHTYHLMQEATTTYVHRISLSHPHTLTHRGRVKDISQSPLEGQTCVLNKNDSVYSPTESSVVPHLGQPLYIQPAENSLLIFHGWSFHSLLLYFKKGAGSVGGGGCLEFVNGVWTLYVHTRKQLKRQTLMGGELGTPEIWKPGP